MLSFPCLDEVGPADETDEEVDGGKREARLGQASYGVHFGTMLLACQVVAGNSFDTAYLSYDRKGNHKVQLAPHGILTHNHYFLHVPQSRTKTGKAHVIPQSQDKWYTDNAMCDYSQGAHSVYNSVDNVVQLRVDLHRIFDDRAFALVPKADAEGRQHTVVHFFSTTNNAGDAAFWHHNQKVHSLESVAPQFLFARFALAVFARIKDFILRGERRQIAVVLRGIDSYGSPAWVTRQVEMDRAQRLSRYGAGGSRGSSPSKRSRPQSESQQEDDQESSVGVEAFGNTLAEPRDHTSRIRAWLQANETDDDKGSSKRRRIGEDDDFPPSLTSAYSFQTHTDEWSSAAKTVEFDRTGTVALSQKDEVNHGDCEGFGLQVHQSQPKMSGADPDPRRG
ncbi:hypothetical protein MY1884_004658 [Beauveria asiatica]